MPGAVVILLRFCLLLLLFAGCSRPAPQGEIADLHLLPQDAWYYVDPQTVDRPLLEASEQHAAARRFLDRYFGPWRDEARPMPADKTFAPLKGLFERPVYGSNLLPYSDEEKGRLVDLCDVSRYPSLALRAVTVRDTDLRALPTRRPGFADPEKAGEGYPFDYFQYSSIRANTPLHISHRSADGAWYFVETPDAAGWLPVPDAAPVDEAFIARFRAGRYLTVVREKVPLLDSDGNYRQSLSIGALLPLADSPVKGDWRVLIAVTDSRGRAQVREALLAGEAAAPWPLPATPATLAPLVNQMLGQPYGWGGLCGDRDCSATLQDLFAAIGLPLPRNSARQMERGRTISLEGLPPALKEERLLAQGKPFMTLVGMRGHVMLYIGRKDGQAVVLHTQWGLRTRSAWSGEGRHLVGKTVITSLQPGRELPHLQKPEGDLRWRIDAISLLHEPGNKTGP